TASMPPDLPVSSPSYFGTWWTSHGVEILDDADTIYRLDGTETDTGGPLGLQGWGRGSTGLVVLTAAPSQPDGPWHWGLAPNVDVNRGVALPQLDGQTVSGFAVDGERAYVLSPAGLLLVVSLAEGGRVIAARSTAVRQLPLDRITSFFTVVPWGRNT